MALTTLPLVLPFRLDLTVAALRRLPSNPVDCWEAERYLRAFESGKRRLSWAITQGEEVVVDSSWPPAASLARRMLGTDLDLSAFYRRVRTPALRTLVQRFRGLKPPRFSGLWESFVNTVAFQQLSLASGMAAVRRLVLATSEPVLRDGVPLHPFPPAERVAGLGIPGLRSCGFSTAKASSLQALARLVADGELREETLEALPSAEAARLLCGLPGIGRWTADLVLLRGLRRLDVFPGGDAGAARGFERFLPGLRPEALLDELGPYRGMLYFHLLLASRFPQE